MQEEIQERILTKGIRAGDIKHPGRLADDQIRSIPISHVYTWVRTSEWKKKDFDRWLKAFGVVE